MKGFPIAKSQQEFQALTETREHTKGAVVWLVQRGEYEQTYIDRAFTTEGLADAYAALHDDATVIECDLFDRAPARIRCYIRIAEVYPDGTVRRSSQTEMWDEPGPPAVDDHLRRNLPAWDGHTQGHCGEHIYVSGSDGRQVEAHFREWIAEAQARQNGKCAGCGRTGPYQEEWSWKPEEIIGWKLVPKEALAEKGALLMAPLNGETECTRCGNTLGPYPHIQTKLVPEASYGRNFFRALCKECDGPEGRCVRCDAPYRRVAGRLRCKQEAGCGFVVEYSTPITLYGSLGPPA